MGHNPKQNHTQEISGYKTYMLVINIAEKKVSNN